MGKVQIIRVGDTWAVESRIRLTEGFGFTPGKLLTRSNPNLYPKSVRTPEQKFRKNPER